MTTEERVESETTPEGEDDSPVLRQLRDKVRDLEGQLSSKSDVERQLAFVKAGVDVDTKAGKYFYKAYEGELDAEAIQAEAAEIGIMEAPKQEKQEIPAEEQKQTQERSNLGTGAVTDEQTGEDPKDRAMRNAEAAMEAGATTEDALGEAFGTLAFAAYKDGDERAIYDPRNR